MERTGINSVQISNVERFDSRGRLAETVDLVVAKDGKYATLFIAGEKINKMYRLPLSELKLSLEFLSERRK